MISVLIVNHNGASTLERCVESLGSPPPPELEVLLVDNGSDDGSRETVRDRFPHVKVIALRENRGFGAANNIGAARACGDRLLLLNSDAWLEGDALGAMQRRLESDPGLGLVAPRLTYPDGSPQLGWSPDRGVLGEGLQLLCNRFEHFGWFHRVGLASLRRIMGPGWYTAACVLLRGQAFHSVGGFDERFFLYFEDADLCVRLRAAGWRLGFEPGAVVRHVRGGSIAGEARMLEYRRSQLNYYREHRPRWEAAALRRYLISRNRRGPIGDWLRRE